MSLPLKAVEIGRSWTVSESRRQAIMENVIDVYFQMVQACINAGNLEKAPRICRALQVKTPRRPHGK